MSLPSSSSSASAFSQGVLHALPSRTATTANGKPAVPLFARFEAVRANEDSEQMRSSPPRGGGGVGFIIPPMPPAVLAVAADDDILAADEAIFSDSEDEDDERSSSSSTSSSAEDFVLLPTPLNGASLQPPPPPPPAHRFPADATRHPRELEPEMGIKFGARLGTSLLAIVNQIEDFMRATSRPNDDSGAADGGGGAASHFAATKAAIEDILQNLAHSLSHSAATTADAAAPPPPPPPPPPAPTPSLSPLFSPHRALRHAPGHAQHDPQQQQQQTPLSPTAMAAAPNAAAAAGSTPTRPTPPYVLRKKVATPAALAAKMRACQVAGASDAVQPPFSPTGGGGGGARALSPLGDRDGAAAGGWRRDGSPPPPVTSPGLVAAGMGMRRGSAEDESHLRRYEQRLRLMENMQAEWMDRKRALETEVVTLSRQKEKHASNEARLNRQLWNMELQNQQLLERNALLELESDRIRSQMRALDGKHLALQEEIERLRNSTVTSKEDADAWERRVRELEVEVSRRGLLAGRLLAERELHTRQMSELEEENGRMFRRPDAELGDSAKEEQDGASAERVFGMDVVPSDSDSHSSRPVNAPKYPDRRGSVLSPPANASPSGPDWNLVDSMADALQQSQGQMEALKGENDVLRKSLAEVLALLDATRDMMDSMRGESSLFVQQPPPPETLADLRTRTPSPIIDPPKIAFVPAVTEQPQPAETAKSTPTGSSPVSHAVSDDERDDDDNTPLNQLVRVGSLRSSSQQVSEATLRGVAMSEAMMSELNLLISDPIDLDMSISRTSAPVLCGSPVLPLPQVPPKSRSVQQSMNTLSSSIPRKIVLSRPAFYRPLQNIKSYSSQSVPAVAARLYALGSGRSSTMADSPRTSFDAGSSKGSDGDHVYQNAAAVDALTETMVGAWFQKYNRHRRFPKLRFFWVNPYGRVLNWAPNSTTKRKEGVARTAVIEGVVAAPTPMAEHHKNFPPNEQHAITIITRRRAIVIVPTNWTDHATWILGLNLLVSENGMQPLHERFKFVDVRRSLDRERPPAAASSAQQEERGRTAVTRTTTNNPKVDAGGSSASSSYEDAITPIGSSLSTPQRTQSPSPAPSVSFASADEPPSTTALAPPYVKPQSRLQRRISGIFSRSSSKPALSAAASLDTISAGSETEEISYVRRALGRNSPQPGRKGSLKDSWRRSIDLRGSERKHLRVSTLPSSAAREDGNDGGGGGSPK